MEFNWRIKNIEHTQGDSFSLLLMAERGFNAYNVAEAYLTSGFVDTVCNFVSCTMYIEEVLDTVGDRFIRCVLALRVVF